MILWIRADRIAEKHSGTWPICDFMGCIEAATSDLVVHREQHRSDPAVAGQSDSEANFVRH